MGARLTFLQLLETSPNVHDLSKMIECDLVLALAGSILESNYSGGLIWLEMVTVRYMMVMRVCSVSPVCHRNGKCIILI